ncbi:hypothetical protein PROFUN_16124, partial [Planoprotostelium fungivorum]
TNLVLLILFLLKVSSAAQHNVEFQELLGYFCHSDICNNYATEVLIVYEVIYLQNGHLLAFP